MKTNVGGLDRKFRWVVGTSLLVLGWKKRGWLRWASWTLGANFLTTAATTKCLINQKLGINTFPDSKAGLSLNSNPTIQESSEESFPASDAPAWTMGR